eukprot:6970056-Alexandrium_andersonii.AAC.1
MPLGSGRGHEDARGDPPGEVGAAPARRQFLPAGRGRAEARVLNQGQESPIGSDELGGRAAHGEVCLLGDAPVLEGAGEEVRGGRRRRWLGGDRGGQLGQAHGGQ